jgi:cyclopropane fatty-acyl-phospholipid synthase-like methyltransferase
MTMSYTLVREDEAPWAKMARPFIKVLRLAYIQGTTVVKLLPSERAIQLYYKYRRKSYDLQWAMDPGYRKGLNRLVQMTVTDADRVLDVGCGTGSATVIAAANAKEVVGIDLSPDMIELAQCKVKKRAIDNCALTATSVEDYCPEQLFDKVISSFMIPHVKPTLRPAIYSCMYSFLKPGGTVGLFGSRGEVCEVYETRQKAEENLKRAGFEQIAIYDIYDIYRIALARKPE